MPNRNPDRDEFFAYCESVIDPSVPTLLCGDFNAVLIGLWFGVVPLFLILPGRVAPPCRRSSVNAVFLMFGVFCTLASLVSL